MRQGTRRGIACAGNWILDMVNDLPHWPDKSELVHITAQTTGLGGGAANVAGALAAMGAPYPVFPVGLIGAGMVGDEVLRLCRAAGLPTDRIGRTASATTAQTLVMNVPGDSRTFFYHPGANDLLDAAAIDVPGLADAGARIFYLGYLTLLGALDRIGPDGRTAAAHVLADARGREMLTCVDLVSARGPQYRETVMATLPEIDILLLNEIEAARATGLSIVGAGDVRGMEGAARALCDGGVRRAVILHSAAHVVWFEDAAAHVFDTPPVPPEDVVSPVGAGDAFAAGVLHGLHDGWPRDRAVELGFRAARACLAAPTATGGLTVLRGVLGHVPRP
ncbi:carbohydrate kinase family protein [Meridianimarinicoccus sp. RP-17]|uniref:carbohydrate kinase family protein n=1 Tax=Meridianimarinicoccus zhengii TaxID=2056810 RepID=UPI000DAEC62F|nr:carbohydrate kinase family protein [Phycocomes zhengii]